ncbi:MAG: FHA domain-containing protein [Pyrinomonadaceae bacterium]
MTELKLEFKDEKGEPKQISVSADEFFIGRHSENDLSIADSAISRKHLKIQRYADVFVASELGSTLGTKINGEKLTEPVALKNGDKFVLGDNIEIDVLLEDENAGAFDNSAEKNAAPEISARQVSVSANENNGSSVPMNFFIIAPVLGIVILLLLGGVFLLIKSREKKEVVQGNDFIYTGNRLREKNQNLEIENLTEKIETGNKNSLVNENLNSANAEFPSNSEMPETNSEVPVNQPLANENAGDLAKIEINSASFLRRISQRDPRAALTGKQQEIINSKIRQFKNSSALAANLKSARANLPQIQNLASQKNLKPQFLTAAALAKLGNSQGDVFSAAQSMANVLDELSRNVGDEFSDDSLLVIAAYEQGASGQTLEMRNMMQGLTDKFPESSRRIRTIWFLKDNGKITDSQFEFALRFLAVGTISQNPREFGVNAEAVKF